MIFKVYLFFMTSFLYIGFTNIYVSDENIETCSICLDCFIGNKGGGPFKLLVCSGENSHCYHKRCLGTWINGDPVQGIPSHKTCPICLKNITSQDKKELNDDGSYISEQIKSCDKLIISKRSHLYAVESEKNLSTNLLCFGGCCCCVVMALHNNITCSGIVCCLAMGFISQVVRREKEASLEEIKSQIQLLDAKRDSLIAERFNLDED